MNLVQALTLLATAINGLLAGGSFDTSLVKLPARRRIGNVAYAAFARGNDLGNGLVFYPAIAISAALLVFIATIVSFLDNAPSAPLAAASVTSVLHFLATAKAAPIMLSLKNTPDDEARLKDKLDQFERWHAVRMVLQVITFLILLCALILAGRPSFDQM
jgi:hypothetical protein